VFPVEPMAKTPHRIYPDKPYTIKWGEAATSDVRKVVEYWTWSPTANIGIACAPSNLFVVDCDMPKREYQLRDTSFAYLHDAFGPLVDGSDVFQELCKKIGIDWNEANNTYRVHGQWVTITTNGLPTLKLRRLTVKGIVDVRGNGGDQGSTYLCCRSRIKVVM
jgi:hypothetical protein